MNIKKSKGQLSIFVVLIFQIIFVLFAMTVNISLVIYDKINLQNAVDLSAYYVAQKQAEILNVVAHQNYQIRQAWKLLSFRYRVLGTLGLNDHPVEFPNINYLEEPFDPVPTICISNSYWNNTKDGASEECQKVLFKLPPLPRLVPIAPTPYVIAAQLINERNLQNYEDACKRTKGLNWYFMARILSSFRIDQRNRRRVINSMAELLKNNHFTELEGVSVLEGARKTFLKNLSEKNREGFETTETLQGTEKFVILNSLQGLEPHEWLVPIKVEPLVYFSELSKVTRNVGVACDTYLKNNNDNFSLDEDVRDDLNLTQADVNSLKEWSLTHVSNNSNIGFLDFTLGVEKNPWLVVYSATAALFKSRPIFTPFGEKQITLRARGFAKPFGGRIGPWAYTAWPTYSQESQGGNPTESVIKVRTDIGAAGTFDPNDRNNYQAFLPNFSRYPGDRLGLRSKKALSDFKIESRDLFLSHYSFTHFQENIANDLIAHQVRLPNRSPVNIPLGELTNNRKLEIAAIRPNLFDIYYYSIMNNFGQSYLQKMRKNRDILNLGGIPLRGDLIARDLTFEEVLSVKDQLHLLYTKVIHKPDRISYMINDGDWTKLLTDWTSSQFNQYKTASQEEGFMRCDHRELEERRGNLVLFHRNENITLPHSCIGPGRSGYSVKFVSKHFLNSNQHSLGGDYLGQGTLLNPPQKFKHLGF